VSHVVTTNFRVISQTADGESVSCSYCARGVKHVVVLPLTKRLELDSRFPARGGDLWAGLCAYCVLALAKALAAAEAEAKVVAEVETKAAAEAR
jgi:hypothetical protein